jgi:hypothetical protein
LVQKAEQHMIDKLKVSKGSNKYKKYKETFDYALIDWINQYKAKSLDSKVGIAANNAADKHEYFFTKEIYMKENNVEIIRLNKCEIKITRGAKETMSLEFIRRMENELNNYNHDDCTVSWLTMKTKRLVFTRYKNVYEQIR